MSVQRRGEEHGKSEMGEDVVRDGEKCVQTWVGSVHGI